MPKAETEGGPEKTLRVKWGGTEGWGMRSRVELVET